MKKKIWKNYFDIVILPPEKVSEYAVTLSKKFARYGTKWTLGKKVFIPHISLYHIAVKPKKFGVFVREIKKTIQDFSPGYLKTTVVESNLLMFDNPKWIQKLYLRIMRNTLKYYDWDYGTENYWSVYRFPKKMQKVGIRFIKKYGTPMAGSNFRPHITLASFKKDLPNLTVKKAKPFQFKPAYVYLCELGPSHSCQRVVKKFSFSK